LPEQTSLRIEIASVDQVDGVWPLIAEGVAAAALRTGGDTTPEYLWSECRSGRAFLIVVSREKEVLASSVWRFEAWQTGRKFKCLSLSGRHMSEWIDDLRAFVEKLARVGGANALVTEGRIGWGRKYKARILRQLYEIGLPDG